MTLPEAPQRQPLKEKFLGYRVPDEFRPVEKMIVDLQVIGWGHLIFFFLYASDPECDTEKCVKQSLGSFTPNLKNNYQQQIWNLAKEQLGKLPLGPKVLSSITANRPDLV